MKRRLKYLFFLALFVAGFILATYFQIEQSVSRWIYSDIDRIPPARVGLVLGTAKYTRDGRRNLYYIHRLRAAERLFRSGKVQYLLLSGDNSTKHYNEPATMRKDLIRAGIPKERIFLDYAGFRTFDSMLRAKEIFGLDTLIVISQNFHVRRAVYIGRRYGMHPYGLAVQGAGRPSDIKMFLRELLARIRVKIDILWGNRPKFLGKKIHIG